MSKEHAYAYEAGYRDGSINYELEHCPACKNVADLQEALAENAKLRELVRGLNWCTEGVDGPRVDCEHCPLGVVEGKPLELMCEKMMRELGVVD